MRVHVFLLTLLAVSIVARGAPTPEDAVEKRLGESDEEVDQSAVARAEAAAQFYNSMVKNQGPASMGQPNNRDGNVFIKVSKWTLKLVYDFVSRVYEKLKSVFPSSQATRDSGASVGGATVSEDDMSNLYSVLYLLYNLVEGEPQDPGAFYGPSPMAYAASASASASASSRLSNTRKRSLIPEMSNEDSLDEEDFRKASKKTVANILAKFQEFIEKKEREVKEQQLKEKQQKEKEKQQKEKEKQQKEKEKQQKEKEKQLKEKEKQQKEKEKPQKEKEKKEDKKITKDVKTGDTASTDDDATKEVAADKKTDKKKLPSISATHPHEKSKPKPEAD